MKKSNFWLVTLCILLVVAGVTGWNIYTRIAVAANALVVLIDVARRVWALIKKNNKTEE